MGTQALFGPVLPSPPRGRDGDSIRNPAALGQTRLTPSTASRASRRISWTRGTLRRSRGLFHTPSGRRPRRVRGIYAGLSNTR